MFSTAKSLDKKPTAAKKKDKAEVEMQGVKDLALLKALIANATTMAASIEGDLKARGFEVFMESKGSTRPSSFSGVEGEASCSVEMRKRSTMSALTDDEVGMLRKAGIEPFKQVVTQELFAINPVHAQNQDLLAKVEKSLGKIAGLPDDFIVKQEGVSKYVVSDEMLDEAFKKAGTDDGVLQAMTVMALKPKLSAEYNMDNLVADALAVMQPAKKAVALPKAKKAA
jgi:hypothetical protein